MKIYTADKETGTFIEEFDSIKKAKDAIARYETDDEKEGIFEPDFYDIVNENHESIIDDILENTDEVFDDPIEGIIDKLNKNLYLTTTLQMKLSTAFESYNKENDPRLKLDKNIIYSKCLVEYETAFAEGANLLTEANKIMLTYLNNKQFDEFKKAKKLIRTISKISCEYQKLNAMRKDY